MTRKEQIIELVKNTIKQEYFTEWVHEEPHTRTKIIGFEELADAILALPLDIPSVDESNYEANKYGEIDKPDYGVKDNASLDFVRGAMWVCEEIIKRNK